MGGVGGVGFAQSFSCPTSNYSWVEVTLQLSWGFDNILKPNTYLQIKILELENLLQYKILFVGILFSKLSQVPA